MQIFANGKRRFHSFTELYVIQSKNQGVKFDHSITLKFWDLYKYIQMRHANNNNNDNNNNNNRNNNNNNYY